MLKIVHVSGINPFSVKPSGMYAYMAGLASTLSKKGVDVAIIGKEMGEEELQTHNIKLIPIKMKKATSIIFLTKLMVKAPFWKLSENAIIHGHRPDFLFPFIIFSRRNPKVCTLHGIPNINVKTRKNLLIWGIYTSLEKLSLRHIDRFIAVNRSTKQYYSEKEPKIKNRIVVIPVGIDTQVFKPIDQRKMRKRYGFDQKEKIILYVGRFSIEKRLDLLLKVFKDLKEKISNARLVLVGNGLEEIKLRNIVKMENIEDVTFMNSVKHEKIPEIINCADVLALCSLFEGMPTVVLEALACGVPVVATDVGDVSCVVKDNETGFLVKERDRSQISDRLLKVIDWGRESYSQRCIEVAGAYSWNNVTERILNVYSELIEAKSEIR
jgi:glycosyltransferase involved in cell wall biosynthesis